MATKPKQKMDVDAAAKAVEDALDVELTFDDLEQPDLSAMSDEEVFNELERKLSAAAEDLKEVDRAPNQTAADQPAKKAGAAKGSKAKSEFESMRPTEFVAANDDRRDAVAELVYGLQRKASNVSLVLAAIVTVCWLAVVWYYIRATDPLMVDFSSGLGSRLLLAKTYLYIGLAFIPVLMIWAFAILTRRAQEMRHAAHSMTEAAIQLMQPENIATDSISTVGRAIRREVAAMGDGVERALARAGELENMVQSEVLNLQRSYSDSEIRLRTLLVDLANERENVVGHAEKLRASISGSHVGLTEELNAASSRIQGVIDQATSQLSDTLVQREQGIQATLSDAGENLVSLLSSSGVEIEGRIASGTKQIEDQLSARTQDLTQQISMAGSAMANLLDTQSARLEEQSAASTRQFEDAIGLRIAEFTSRFDESSGTLQSQLDSRLGLIDQTLTTKGDAFVQALGSRTEALDKVLNDRTVYISDTLKERLSSFGHAMTSHLDQVNENMTNQLNAANASLSERQQSLERTTEAIGASIEARAQKLEEGLKMHHADIAASLGNGLAAVTQKAAEIRSGLETQSTQFIEGLDDKSKGLLSELDSRISSLLAGVEGNAENLKSLLEQKTSVIAETMSSGSEILFSGFDSQASNLRTDLEKRSANLVENLAAQSQGFAENLEARVSAIQSSVEAKGADLIGNLSAQSRSLEQNLDARVNSLQSTVEEKAASLLSGLDERHAGIDKLIASRTSILNETLGERAEQINREIDARTNALNDDLKLRSDHFAEGLESRVNKVADDIDQRSDKLLSSIDDRAGKLGTLLADGEATIVSAVENKYGLFSQMLAEKQQAISLDLDQKIEKTAGVIDEKAAAISDILTERAALINSTLGEGLSDSQRMLEAKTREFNELLSSRSSELSAILDETALPLVDQIKTQGDLVATKLGSVHTSLNNDVEGLLERLGNVGASMAELISKAGADLNSMEETITAQAANMSEAVLKARLDVDQSSELAQVAHQKMDETATNLLANIGAIAERFEQQCNMLERATALIDQAQRSFASTLDDKDSSLSELASGLVQRTSEIEKSMAAFGEMLTRTMDEMTQRSRMVGSTVSSEIGAAIEETTARYAAATEAMRAASQEVQRDLEETRAQMRRGVMELPDETRQSADAMRKVVADQIAALRDLSEIVTKSGKSLDTAAAVAPQQQAQRFAANAQPRPLSAPIPQPTAAPASRSEDPAASATRPRSNLDRVLGSRTATPPRPESAPRDVAPRATQQQAPQGTGWVSDLLKRASVEEPPVARNAQSELHKIESLNALSMDIARLMDDEASIDLWNRYQRGERNVFTRRLYTLQGQQTFDEIRNKYAREPEFRRAVDRYIDDFERLLSDVVQNDRDNIMTQTYLTSDTGKVYTMLAHASGRLGN